MISGDADQVYVWLTWLRDRLGYAFLCWVLGDETPPLTPAQQEVVIVLYRSCSPFTGQLNLSAVDFLVSNRGRPGQRELLAKLNLGTADFLVPRPPGFDAGHAGSMVAAA